MYCPKCGTKVEDTASFCFGCGNALKEVVPEVNEEKALEEKLEEVKEEEAKAEVSVVEEPAVTGYAEVPEEDYDEAKTAKVTKNYIIIGIIVLAVLFAGTIGAFVVVPQISQRVEMKENQKEADKVINMIADLEGQEITLEMEDELKMIQLSYDALTSKQQELVVNYAVLEQAFKDLTHKMDQQVAMDLDAEIAAINISALTSDDTKVMELRARYNALSEEQKKYVMSIHKLDECEKAIQAKGEEERKQQAIQDQIETTKGLLYNFDGFYGLWGNFGKHVNQHQGMIEAAIKNEISFKTYFQGSPNDLEFYVSSFHWDGQNVGTAGCEIEVYGPLKDTGEWGYMSAGIIVKNDGKLDFYINYIY